MSYFVEKVCKAMISLTFISIRRELVKQIPESASRDVATACLGGARVCISQQPLVLPPQLEQFWGKAPARKQAHGQWMAWSGGPEQQGEGR